MAITFAPQPGMILICDFSTGFKPPEMVKIRPVVIISPRRRVSSLCTIVPLSSVAPDEPMPWHHPITRGIYPGERSQLWAKCDLVSTVSCERLDRVKVRDFSGKRSYQTVWLPAVDMAAISTAVKAALGLT